MNILLCMRPVSLYKKEMPRDGAAAVFSGGISVLMLWLYRVSRIATPSDM